MNAGIQTIGYIFKNALFNCFSHFQFLFQLIQLLKLQSNIVIKILKHSLQQTVSNHKYPFEHICQKPHCAMTFAKLATSFVDKNDSKLIRQLVNS